MKTITDKMFDEKMRLEPNKSSYLCFAELITGKKINRFDIRRLFKKFVSKDDYFKEEKDEVVSYLAGI